jgi:hypothetical protein
MDLLSEQAQFYKQILVCFFSKWYFQIKYCSINYMVIRNKKNAINRGIFGGAIIKNKIR